MGSVAIDGRSVGRIIGPKGATIRQLQSDFNVNISISKEDDAVKRRFSRNLTPIVYEFFCFRTATELQKSMVPRTTSRELCNAFRIDSAWEAEADIEDEMTIASRHLAVETSVITSHAVRVRTTAAETTIGTLLQAIIRHSRHTCP